ncbi:ABC transporter [Microbacterium sp. XT11]|uniref:ABC transporter n=1 Tax=Microbacterium sp. XT11 TaxID=367477 RepID=UPI000743149A|nr:ABC transporter [Microbacterium sp. XT11]ALX65609.1 hypothetical protein AB663_000185 [Microbacterium sp. XT11]
MSDPEAPRPEQPSDVNDVVDSANAGLDAAAAAGADVPGASAKPVDAADADAKSDVDPDLAAFEAAEREHPGTFSTPELNQALAADTADDQPATAAYDAASDRADAAPDRADAASDRADAAPVEHHESAMTDAAYAPPAADAETRAETRIVPSEPAPVEAAAAPTLLQQQPIFVQAPEPPRERGNRGTAGLIGLLATLAFAVLYLGTILGLGAIAGDVTGENIGDAALAPLTTWGFWVPVVVFFLGFWLLGAFINRGRWGLWVVFGIIVGVFAYGGYILGQLFEAPFWSLTTADGAELVNEQLLSPLAIAAFVFGRELTIWFGAWVARSGARKTELNAEAQREYERTLEAGPTLAR